MALWGMLDKTSVEIRRQYVQMLHAFLSTFQCIFTMDSPASMEKDKVPENQTPPTPHLPPSHPLRFRIPRIDIVHIRIHRPQLRAPQSRQVTRNGIRQRLQRRRQILVQPRHDRGRFRLHELENEAFEIVALSQSGAVEDTICQVGNVEAREGVRGAGVATDGEEARVEQAEGEDVQDEAVRSD